MGDFLVVAMVGFAMFAVFCFWRVCTLLGGWKPAVAHVWRSDYTQDQQSEDRWSLGMTAFTSRGYNWRDGDDMRWVEDEIRFTDASGHEHRALVQRHVIRGWRPSQNYPIWYDPADPTKVTARGPFHWCGIGLLSAVVVVMLVRVLLALGPAAFTQPLFPH